VNRSGAYIRQASNYRAFIPKPLPPKPAISLKGDMQGILSNADMSLARLDGIGRILPNIDLFIAMFIRKEALLSSQIEGTQASLEDLFELEFGGKPDNMNDVAEVVNYIAALNYGTKRLKSFPMSLRLFNDIHKVLMKGVRGGNKKPGQMRMSQNWIGPAGCTLNEATFVPPPANEAKAAMGDLEKYIYADSKIPVLINCALIHYQFETIHPYLDGNGRLGRLLITFYLTWKEVLHRPLLYLSYYFKRLRQEYYDRLNLVRENGDYEQWISFFLKGIIETSDYAVDSARRILELQTRHRNLLWKEKISSPLAVGILEKLYSTPYVAVKSIAESFDISFQAASVLVSQLEKAGILKEITGRKRDKRYVYSEYLNILSEGTKQ